MIPVTLKRWLKVLRPRRGGIPPVGGIRFGDFAHGSPFSRWGFGRGQPIDRHYVEAFLAGHRADIRGRVLEIGDDGYTRMFGDDVERSDVLHVVAGTPGATIIGDLTVSGTLPAESFDCIICTQTLQQIFDVPAALRTMHAALSPGGVLLATVPGISQIDRKAMERWGDYWRFTTRGFAALIDEEFGPGSTSVTAFGSALSSAAFLYGIGREELGEDVLARRDPDYELVIGARATSAASDPPAAGARP